PGRGKAPAAHWSTSEQERRRCPPAADRARAGDDTGRARAPRTRPRPSAQGIRAPGEAVTTAERTLEVAADVARILKEHGYGAAVSGAGALAARGYPRATIDLDLATLVQPDTLRALGALAETFRARGYEVEVVEPDADDPLGGVVNIQAAGA